MNNISYNEFSLWYPTFVQIFGIQLTNLLLIICQNLTHNQTKSLQTFISCALFLSQVAKTLKADDIMYNVLCIILCIIFDSPTFCHATLWDTTFCTKQRFTTRMFTTRKFITTTISPPRQFITTSISPLQQFITTTICTLRQFLTTTICHHDNVFHTTIRHHDFSSRWTTIYHNDSLSPTNFRH